MRTHTFTHTITKHLAITPTACVTIHTISSTHFLPHTPQPRYHPLTHAHHTTPRLTGPNPSWRADHCQLCLYRRKHPCLQHITPPTPSPRYASASAMPTHPRTILGLPNIPVHSMAAEAAATADHTRFGHCLALIDATATTVFILAPRLLLPNSLLLSLERQT